MPACSPASATEIVYAVLQALRQLTLGVPDLLAGSRVDRPRMVERTGHVEHAVQDERRRFELVDDAGLECPLRSELTGIRRGDLRERTEPLAGVVPRIDEPA